MASPNDNLLQAVQTYNKDGLEYLQNYGCMIHTFNKKFDNFQNIPGQLGQTVGAKLPYRFTTQESLVVSLQPIDQRIFTLTVDKKLNTSYAMSAEQFIFNLATEGDALIKGAIKELAPKIEKDIATVAETKPYRFYGHGEAITSPGQLATAYASMADFGMADGTLKGYLPSIIVPSIVNQMQNQFVPMRNEEVAHKWMIGSFSDIDWYRTNVLPRHISGSVGQAGTVLTVVSTNDPTGEAITSITFSGAANNDPDAIKANDSIYFTDNTFKFLTFTGHFECNAEVQIRALTNVASNGSGLVTVTFDPLLSSTPGANQNLNQNIVPGMQVKILDSHLCGLLVSGEAAFLAMPKLPSTSPFDSHSEQDAQTGASFRSYHGYKFGEDIYGIVNDVIWGKTAIPEYLEKIVIPFSQLNV